VSDLSKLMRKLRAQGADISRGHDHHHVRREGRLVLVVPMNLKGSTAGRHLKNSLGTLRRAGFDV
jgi:hypothetical protein